MVAAIAGAGAYATMRTAAQQGAQVGAPVDGIQCGAREGQAEHIHTHLALYRGGASVTLPASIGIPVNQTIAGGSCFYWLHTHATTAVIHIEAPASGLYTLGQFFDIWRATARWDRQSTEAQMPLVDASFADALRAASAQDIHVYVGHTLVGAGYQGVTLADHKDITIELGTPLRSPVATFDWAHWPGL